MWANDRANDEKSANLLEKHRAYHRPTSSSEIHICSVYSDHEHEPRESRRDEREYEFMSFIQKEN